MYAISLECLDCGRKYSLDEVVYTCIHCRGLLDIKYDYSSLQEEINKEDLYARKIYTMWRYSEFLPLDMKQSITLGEGFTPLIKSEVLGRALGLKNLYLKLDFTCPTGSFKDRGASIMVSKAKQMNMKIIAIDSSGNAAASVAAYSAKAALKCYVFSPSYASIGKLVQSMAYGATVFTVDGTRKDTYETAKAAYKHFGWYYCGFQTNPYAIEGLKLVAHEICEQLGWAPPDRVVIPVGTGGNLVGCWKGLRELYQLAWIPNLPSLACIQPEGCAPIVKAYKNGLQTIIPVDKPTTVAEGLMIGHPLRGGLVLEGLSETDGVAEAVSDSQIMEAGKLLARTEGVFVEPSAATSIAGVVKLVDEGVISRDETIVCILTGTGLKTSEVYSETVGKTVKIKPGLDDVESFIQRK